jgi:hypothetical protein
MNRRTYQLHDARVKLLGDVQVNSPELVTCEVLVEEGHHDRLLKVHVLQVVSNSQRHLVVHLAALLGALSGIRLVDNLEHLLGEGFIFLDGLIVLREPLISELLILLDINQSVSVV